MRAAFDGQSTTDAKLPAHKSLINLNQLYLDICDTETSWFRGIDCSHTSQVHPGTTEPGRPHPLTCATHEARALVHSVRNTMTAWRMPYPSRNFDRARVPCFMRTLAGFLGTCITLQSQTGPCCPIMGVMLGFATAWTHRSRNTSRPLLISLLAKLSRRRSNGAHELFPPVSQAGATE